MKSSTLAWERDTFVEFLDGEALEPGEYWIQVKVDWDQAVFPVYQSDLTLNVNAYGQGPVDLVVHGVEDLAQFTEAWIREKAASLEDSVLTKLSPDVEVYRYTSPEPEGGFRWTYITNRDAYHTYEENCTYTAFQGCTLIDNH